MKYLSVCSGIEAATVAWHSLGWQPVMFAEIEPFPAWVLHTRYGASRPLQMPSPNVAETRKEAKRRAAAIRNVIALPASGAIPNAGDFTRIGADDAGAIDLLAGGTPCQSFSIAGNRAGLDDPRGNLTIEFARLAGRVRPLWLVWENVPGVLSIDGGRTFGAFLGMLVELGYGIAYRILDASMRRPVYVKRQISFFLRWFHVDLRGATATHKMIAAPQKMPVLPPRFHSHSYVSHPRLGASWGPRFSRCCDLSSDLLHCTRPRMQIRSASRAQSPELGAGSVERYSSLCGSLAPGQTTARIHLQLFRCCSLSSDLIMSSSVMAHHGSASRPQSPETDMGAEECIASCRSLWVCLRMQWHIYISTHPELMQQHRQFPGDRNNSSFLAVFSAMCSEPQSPAAQIAVFSKGSENELCALNHHRSQIRIAFFTDPQLWTAASGVSALRTQTNESARIPAALEAMRIFHCQDIRQGYQRPNSFYLGQQRCFWIALLRQQFDPAVIFLNALGQRLDLSQQRLQGGSKCRTKRCRHLFTHLVTPAFPQSFSIGFGNAPCGIDQHRARTHQNSTRSDHYQVRLCFLTAMPDWRQQLRIDPRQTSQLFRIQTIILTGTLCDQPHPSCVGHDHFMSKFLQPSAYPRRMRSSFQGDPRMRHRSKRFLQTFLRSRHAAFQYRMTMLVQNTVTAITISQVKPNGESRSRFLIPFQRLFHSAIPLHGRSPSDYISVCISEYERKAFRIATGLLIPSQYFGVPQRRRRVFVVGHLGDWRRAAAVLLERHSLSGYPPPRRQTRKDLAPTLSTRAHGGGGPGTDFDLDGGLIASTGDRAHCLNAGGMGRQDDETETLIAHSLYADGFDASEDGTGRGSPLVPTTVPQALAFNLRGREQGSVPEATDLASIRAASGGSTNSYLAFSCHDFAADAGEIAPTLRGMMHAEGHANGGGQLAIAAPLTASYAKQADSSDTSSGPPNLLTSGIAVRRLTPRECERLQGFQDDYTHVPYRGKFASDGPRYRALGNSMAVPVMRWIGERIAAVHAIPSGSEVPPCES